MKEYYWEAILIETGERVYGDSFAPSAGAAIEQLESYGLYRNISVEERC